MFWGCVASISDYSKPRPVTFRKSMLGPCLPSQNEFKISAYEATILVSRDSQKSILIGKGGEALKGLGIMARQKLSEFLDREVYLQLLVKTDKNWRQNIDTLTRLGYIESDYN